MKLYIRIAFLLACTLSCIAWATPASCDTTQESCPTSLSLLQTSYEVKNAATRTSEVVADLYMPSVHNDIVVSAFGGSFETSADLKTLVDAPGRNKITKGTCNKLAACSASRGQTDCLLGKCFCRHGYATADGESCKPMSEVPQPAKPAGCGYIGCKSRTKTSGTCGWIGCKSWRGETKCESGSCVCKTGYYTMEGEKCIAIEPGKDLIMEMMGAGVVEPDEMPCPGSTIEMGSQGALMLAGTRKYSMGICRLGIQNYHASPLPLVFKKELIKTPTDNGDVSADNVGKKLELYSLMTYRQWRTSLVQQMSKQFAYSLATPELADGARRLGNLFHTLTDAWSGSHVVRVKAAEWAALNDQNMATMCPMFLIDTAVSMDTVNWATHSKADNVEDDGLWKCAEFYTQMAINQWATERAATTSWNTTNVNAAIDRLIDEVLCPALSFADAAKLDTPAGGATKEWSSDFIGGHQVKPMGVADDADAYRMVGSWQTGLGQARTSATGSSKERYAKNIYLAIRENDACAFKGFAHVTAADVADASLAVSTAVNYLMTSHDPVPPPGYDTVSDEVAPAVPVPVLHEDLEDAAQEAAAAAAAAPTPAPAPAPWWR